MSDEGSFYPTGLGNFALICRHCKKTKEKHVGGKCLFDSASWEPMSQAEYRLYWEGLTDISKIFTAADLEPALTEEEKDAALASWPTPVYAPAPPSSLEDFAVCKHCNSIRRDHIDGKCLFDASMFEVKKEAPRHCTCRNGCKSATCDKL